MIFATASHSCSGVHCGPLAAGGAQQFVVLPGPLAIGALADAVLQGAQGLLPGAAGVFLHPVGKFLKGIQLVGQFPEVLDAVAAPGLGHRPGVHDDQRAQLFRVAGGPNVAVAPAHRVADEVKVGQIQGRHKAVDVPLVGFQRIIAGGGPIAVAVAPLVQGDNVVMLGQGQADKVPTVGLLGTAVEHHDQRIARPAPFQIVEGHPVDLDVPVGRFILPGERHPFLPRRLVKGQTQGMRSHSRNLQVGLSWVRLHNNPDNRAVKLGTF